MYLSYQSVGSVDEALDSADRAVAIVQTMSCAQWLVVLILDQYNCCVFFVSRSIHEEGGPCMKEVCSSVFAGSGMQGIHRFIELANWRTNEETREAGCERVHPIHGGLDNADARADAARRPMRQRDWWSFQNDGFVVME